MRNWRVERRGYFAESELGAFLYFENTTVRSFRFSDEPKFKYQTEGPVMNSQRNDNLKGERFVSARFARTKEREGKKEEDEIFRGCRTS